MQRKLLWSENLTDNAKFWETEQRFDTMDIHEHGFLLLALRFIQNVARNPVLVNNRLSAASYLSQPLASNLAKSHSLSRGRLLPCLFNACCPW
jgi:hypothetical protein